MLMPKGRLTPSLTFLFMCAVILGVYLFMGALTSVGTSEAVCPSSEQVCPGPTKAPCPSAVGSPCAKDRPVEIDK